MNEEDYQKALSKLEAIRELCDDCWINLDYEGQDNQLRDFGLVVTVSDVLEILDEE